jgi:hypothetical protein
VWPFALEIYGPDGYLLHKESLYEFLRRMYIPAWNPDEFRFEELDITVNGLPLLPRATGNA